MMECPAGFDGWDRLPEELQKAILPFLKSDGWRTLPSDVQEYVVAFLDVPSTIALTCTAKHENKVVNLFWEHKIDRDFDVRKDEVTGNPGKLYHNLQQFLGIYTVNLSKIELLSKKQRMVSYRIMFDPNNNIVKVAAGLPINFVDRLYKAYIEKYLKDFAPEDCLSLLLLLMRAYEPFIATLAMNGLTESAKTVLSHLQDIQLDNRQVSCIFRNWFGYAEAGNVKGIKALLTICPSDEFRVGLLLAVQEHNWTANWTALHLAAECGHTETVKMLLASCPTDAVRMELLLAVQKNNWTALYVAAKFGHTGLVNEVIDSLGVDSLMVFDTLGRKPKAELKCHLCSEALVPWIIDNHGKPMGPMNALWLNRVRLLKVYKNPICDALLEAADNEPVKLLPVLRSVKSRNTLLNTIFGTSDGIGFHNLFDAGRSLVTGDPRGPRRYKDIIAKIAEIEENHPELRQRVGGRIARIAQP